MRSLLSLRSWRCCAMCGLIAATLSLHGFADLAAAPPSPTPPQTSRKQFRQLHRLFSAVCGIDCV